MRCPRRGEVFSVEKTGEKYMSLMDKLGDNVRCISQKSKKQTIIGKKTIDHIFSREESAQMLRSFF